MTDERALQDENSSSGSGESSSHDIVKELCLYLDDAQVLLRQISEYGDLKHFDCPSSEFVREKADEIKQKLLSSDEDAVGRLRERKQCQKCGDRSYSIRDCPETEDGHHDWKIELSDIDRVLGGGGSG